MGKALFIVFLCYPFTVLMIQQFHSWVFIHRNKTTNLKRYMSPYMFIAVLYTIAKIWKQPSVYWQVTDKENVTYKYKGILLSHNKEWNITICNSMDGPGGYYAKRNVSDRERQMPYNFTYMWNLKKGEKWTNIRKLKQTHRANKWLLEWEQGELVKQVWEIKRHKLLVRKKWICGCAMYNTFMGNIVNNIVIVFYGDRWQVDLLWWSFCIEISNHHVVCVWN